MSHIHFIIQWPGHSSSTHLESCCIAGLKFFPWAQLVLQRITKGVLRLLPFVYLLLGKHYSYSQVLFKNKDAQRIPVLIEGMHVRWIVVTEKPFHFYQVTQKPFHFYWVKLWILRVKLVIVIEICPMWISDLRRILFCLFFVFFLKCPCALWFWGACPSQF